MNILITGVFGFLGFNLANSLSQNHNVFGIYNKNSREGISSKVKIYSKLEDVNQYPDIIIMCHGAIMSGTTQISSEELIQQNVDFTKTILIKYKEVKVIYFSTVSVFDNNSKKINEFAPVLPTNEYSRSKLEAEKLFSNNKKSIIIRLTSLYGIGMKENTLIPNYINQAISKKCIEIWGRGERFQNYIHILDVIDFVKKIIDFKNEINIPLLLVDSVEYTNFTIAETISKILNCKLEFINEDTSKSVFFDNEFTRNLINWQPRTNLIKGIENYIEWKKEQF